ncbi:hypothetical protein KORDIASMS9_00386 [Kordia sp. SMS9]|uniref:hypothetical protein n=1 Tax=Kordia sp. SMS9 TaxID=2282170 RepID=UPI000E0DCBFA|nr:hypothetical protein [Kordia sp. SMS9]AXG68196.1 hypothetical protein KORDIASMS9_00386 [Kordia sp. SMS9]
MITKKQHEKLKSILGYHYANDVLKILKTRGITNRKGTAYGKSMIRNVYNGLNENKKIEAAIFDLCAQKLKEKEEETNRRNKMLGIESNTDTLNQNN